MRPAYQDKELAIGQTAGTGRLRANYGTLRSPWRDYGDFGDWSVNIVKVVTLDHARKIGDVVDCTLTYLSSSTDPILRE